MNQAITTCFIKRSFTTRAALNKKAGTANDFEDYFHSYESHPQHRHVAHLIADFKALCGLAHLYMFFIGHAKTPQQQLPRYEFFYDESFGEVEAVASKILASLQHCGLTIDYDHSFMSTEPVTYLLPTVAQQAHLLSKDVGRHIDRTTGQWIMSRYRNLLDKK